MMTFYHGTTDALNIKKILLPPTYTNNLREEWCKKYHNMVFFTTSLLSASKFARKACEKYGGNPVIYEVRPNCMYKTAVREKITRSERNYMTKQQMRLMNFCKEFDIARTTALKWIHSDGFPAYNICGHWYVDIDKFYKWRELQHKKSYKYI